MNVLDLLVVEERKTRKDSTHLLILNKGKFKYFISNSKSGEKHLLDTLVSYSLRHYIFKCFLGILPNVLKIKLGIAKYVKLSLNNNLYKYLSNSSTTNKARSTFNILVGTYGKHQKLVFQLFNNNKVSYYKIGTQNSRDQLINEIRFLQNKDEVIGTVLELPEITNSEIIEEIILMETSKFEGEKVHPVFNEKIYLLFKDIVAISSVEKNEEGIYIAFSHGDFAPWNMRESGEKIILFDWEYCKMRFYGFDLIHYNYQIENLLNNKSHEEALDSAILIAKKYDEILMKVDSRVLKKLYEKESEITFNE